jgi:hypothetical protein
MSKVTKLRREAIDSFKDTELLAKSLIKMKFLSKNLIILEKQINSEVHKVLKEFKQSASNASINQLTMVLETKQIGSRIISEHSSLAGQDWRKRREKMQNQDNMKYVLDNLQGDNIDKDALKTHYEIFKEKYNGSVAAILRDKKQSQESSDTSALLSQIKMILLGYIFGLWTCQNTEYYNSSRGGTSESQAQAYLLMPHAAQVISLFRI